MRPQATTRLRLLPLCLAALIPCAWHLFGAPAAGDAAQSGATRSQLTIKDVAAILDQQKPDAAQITGAQATADKAIPTDTAPISYYERAQARGELGRAEEAIADVSKAISVTPDKLSDDVFRYRQFLLTQLSAMGALDQQTALLKQMETEYDAPGLKGRLFYVLRWQVQVALSLGKISLAEEYLKSLERLREQSRKWPNADAAHIPWDRDVVEAQARTRDAHGDYATAEKLYHEARGLDGQIAAEQAKWGKLLARDIIARGLDYDTAFEAITKVHQGRLAEAELDARTALLDWLKVSGKYNADTAYFARQLAVVMNEEGRYGDAERLILGSIDILRTIGVKEDSRALVYSLQHLASTYGMHRKWSKAATIYDQIDIAVRNWNPSQVAILDRDGYRIYADYVTDRLPEGMKLARDKLGWARATYGESHFLTAMSHSVLAMGLARNNQDAEALNEFKIAMPVLFSSAHDDTDDETSTVAAKDQRLRDAVGTYIGVLTRTGEPNDQALAAETFRLAELVRGESVQRALTQSSTRASIADATLSDLARSEQDQSKQIQAALSTLNSTLSLPPAQRDNASIDQLKSEIDKLRTDHAKIKETISARFPRYASLIDPKPPSIVELRARLGTDEALISYYLGLHESFVWVIPKTGRIAFATIPASILDIREKVKKLRRALEPQASDISQVPPFDLAEAYDLYELLLKPVESSWKPARSLIVETSDALGTLPLSLLPVAPTDVSPGQTPFAEYRGVPWLARTHSVTTIPSAAALVTIRTLPPRAPTRDKLIGFGDPVFSAAEATDMPSNEQQVASAAASQLRGVPLVRRASPGDESEDGAELGDLPRLPDTAEELRSIAKALDVDPASALHLGKDANEQAVESADLAHYRIVAFATHGLRTGELEGLEEPALALSDPAVAGVSGDGLLTVHKILGLKLDADWVVLSACNTGAGDGAGAEAASGLGRAFFYAGTQALLVTNWSVHSASARQLVADLFGRQAADPKLTRAEALRQSMMALADGAGFTDASGKMLFSYAHPLFWAPYSIIGDGGH
jgi:CHAT domain-containing protein